MHNSPPPPQPEQWVIWNGSSGILTMGTLGRIETGAEGRIAWLDRPFDMVGPFSLDELESTGRIHFAACMVMSRQRWHEDQVELRREGYEQRRAAQERLNEKYGHFFGHDHGGFAGQPQHRQFDEKQHRETLNLPAEGELEPAQIKKAYRRLAQKAHPDVGGSHEQFLRITEARNALLERAA